MTIHAVGVDKVGRVYVREFEGPDMDWQQDRFHRQARSQATKPVPSWLAVVSAAVVFGAILWTMLEVGFWRMGW